MPQVIKTKKDLEKILPTEVTTNLAAKTWLISSVFPKEKKGLIVSQTIGEDADKPKRLVSRLWWL